MDRRRVTLVVALVASLALVVGLSVSLLSGVGTSSTETATTVPRQRVLQHRPGNHPVRRQGPPDDGRDRGRDGPLPARLGGRWSQPRAPSTGPTAPIGALASHGIRLVPYLWGSPAWVAATPPRPPLDSASDEQAWQDFLQAAVARYGPGGSYWAHDYEQQYGADAKPLPIQSWQIWNEPNLEKYFAPKPSAQEYARLLEISHDAIKSQDPQARIVLAGMPGYGEAEGLGLPGQPLRDTRDSRATSTPPPCIPTLRTSMSSARRSRSSARSMTKQRRREQRRCGSPSSAGDRRRRTSSGSTRGCRARRDC